MDKVIAKLRELSTYYTDSTTQVGICTMIWQLRKRAGLSRKQLDKLLLEWPESSVSSEYPVQHPHLDPHAAYTAGGLWKANEYGDNRRALAKWLANELERRHKRHNMSKIN